MLLIRTAGMCCRLVYIAAMCEYAVPFKCNTLIISQLTYASMLCYPGEALPEFKKPEKWTAPYAMYTPGWWEKFYPKQ